MMFGSSAADSNQYMLDDLDEDDFGEPTDALNDETFGAGIMPEEEWELEDLAVQTESIESTLTPSDAAVSRHQKYLTEADIIRRCSSLESNNKTSGHILQSSDEWYKDLGKSFEEVLQKQLYDILSEDDEPETFCSATAIDSHKSKQENSYVNSFFDVNMPSTPGSSSNNIWAASPSSPTTAGSESCQPTNVSTDFYNRQFPPLGAQKGTNEPKPNVTNVPPAINNHGKPEIEHAKSVMQADSNVALQMLLDKLLITAAPAKIEETTSTPVNAKTVAELEAELISSSKKFSPPLYQPANGDSMASPFPVRPQMVPPLSQQQMMAMAALAAMAPRPPASAGPGMMPPPPWMLNPQIRAAVLACLAAGKPLPPGLFPPPPHGPPHPFAFPGRFPPHMAPGLPPPLDPRLIMAARAAQMMRMDGGSPLVKVRPIVPLVSSGQKVSFMDPNDPKWRFRPPFPGQQHRRRPTSFCNSGEDEYSGLMTRRERDWLIKIQRVQTATDDPYNDDYYWLMFKRKKRIHDETDQESIMTPKDNESIAHLSLDYLDSSSSDAKGEQLEHRAYIPPSFEGSLGKVQFCSTNCPRQIIDVAESSPVLPRKPSSAGVASDGPVLNLSPKQQPLADKLKAAPAAVMSLSKMNTNLLLDVENAYLLALQCDQWLVQLRGFNQAMRQDKIKETYAKIVLNTQKVLTLIADDSRKFQGVLFTRKGRRLLGKIFPFLQDAELSSTLDLFLDVLSKKNAVNLDEPFTFYFGCLRETLQNGGDRNWTNIFDRVLTMNRLNSATFCENRRIWSIVLLLVIFCAKQNVDLKRKSCENLGSYLRSCVRSKLKPVCEVSLLAQDYTATVDSLKKFVTAKLKIGDDQFLSTVAALLRS